MPPRSEERLRSLGDRVAAAGGGGGRRRPPPTPGSSGGGGGGKGRRHRSLRRKVLTGVVGLVVLGLLAAGGAYAYARYRYGQIKKVHVASESPVSPGQPFNMLVVGSDSRLGESAGSGFGTAKLVQGQRSDVLMVWHVVPATKQITITSIPRDTLVQMVGKNVTTFGKYNRINSAYNSGPTLLVQTVQANFGIPISHVVQVNFSGFQGAVDALGGVSMYFSYPTRTTNNGTNESGLDITSPGCHLLNGTQALAVARSRHYEYEVNGTWQGTPTGDLGRIKRQDAFLKALVDAAKSKYNPLTVNAFLGSIPKGLVIDDQFSMSDLLHLASEFHSITPGTIATQTLPTVSKGFVTPWGDVLFVNPSADRQMLAATFGTGLSHATSPPPDATLVPVTVTAAVRGPAGRSGVHLVAATTSTAPGTSAPPSFDPTACKS